MKSITPEPARLTGDCSDHRTIAQKGPSCRTLRGIFPKRIHSDAIAPFALPAGLTAEAERALGLNRVHLSFPVFQRFALGIGGDSLAEMAGRPASNVVMDSGVGMICATIRGDPTKGNGVLPVRHLWRVGRFPMYGQSSLQTDMSMSGCCLDDLDAIGTAF